MRGLFLLSIVLLGCTPSQDEKTLEECKELHDQAMSIGKEVKDRIKSIEEIAKELDAPLRASMQDSVEIAMTDWETWEASIVEVPGHTHDHDHAGHNHDHTPDANLTPEMVLKIQKELKDRITDLNDRTKALLETVKKKKNEFVEKN